MRILLTNDDGPPHPQISPYIASFARALAKKGHNVDVVIPSQQRSWIGKAHLLPASHGITPAANTAEKPGDHLNKNEEISDLLTVKYWVPAHGDEYGDEQGGDGGSTGITQEERPSDGTKYWVLVPSTPAACTQLGLFHHAELFPTSSASPTSSPPYDLVLSGPNLGRNTSATFALASGTLGGALEAAVCRQKAFALSFAFYTKTEGKEIIDEACDLSVAIVEKLYADWDRDETTPETGHGGKDPRSDVNIPDLYSINVPLVAGVSKQPVQWTWMLNNRWANGSLYKHVPTTTAVVAAQEPASDTTTPSSHSTTQDQDTLNDRASSRAAPSFKWAPSFADLWKTIDESPQGNDAKVVRDKGVSVTALKACYMDIWGRSGFDGVLKL